MADEDRAVPSWWRVVAVVATCACVMLLALYANGNQMTENQAAAPQPGATEPAAKDETGSTGLSIVSSDDPLDLWEDDAPLKTELVSYVESVTDESSPDFIPVEDRVATFDFDGTLFCETDPNYFDYTLLAYRVLEDPDYKGKASDFEKSVAAKIVDQNENGTKYEELPVEHGKAVASAFKGLSIDEFYDYVHKFMRTEMPSYEGMRRGEGFYEPMV